MFNKNTLNSSLGFHTLCLCLSITSAEAHALLKDFYNYQSKTQLIKIYHLNKVEKVSLFQPTSVEQIPLPLHFKVYYSHYIGITWNIYTNDYPELCWKYHVEAIINPKFLANENTYITAATLGDLNAAFTNFNKESKKISPILGEHHNYYLKRIDYCINFDLNELTPGCTDKDIINLIRRSNIPTHYKEWKLYDPIAHRMKSRAGSFYLISSSTNINCYSKHMQLKEKIGKTLKKTSCLSLMMYWKLPKTLFVLKSNANTIKCIRYPEHPVMLNIINTKLCFLLISVPILLTFRINIFLCIHPNFPRS